MLFLFNRYKLIDLDYSANGIKACGCMKKIAILTRDCAGINAAIRSIVRTADRDNIEVLGVLRGYDGLIDNKMILLDRRSVSGIINLGGTILKTARSERFFMESGQRQAVKTLEENDIDGLIVIGGDGSLTGAHILATRYNIKIISSKKKYIDEQILENLNEKIIVATNDKELRQKILSESCRVVYMRQKRYLELK